MKKQKVKVPKRIEILPHCNILGLPDVDMKLGPGVYVLGKNMDESLAMRLSSSEFKDIVQVLPDRQPEDKLGTISEGPKSTPGYIYSRKKQHEAEVAAYERSHGSHVRKPEHLQDE